MKLKKEYKDYKIIKPIRGLLYFREDLVEKIKSENIIGLNFKETNRDLRADENPPRNPSSG